MNSTESLCSAIRARDLHQKRLETERAVSPTAPWFRFTKRKRQKRRIADEIERLDLAITSCETKITPEAVSEAAQMAAADLWAKAATSVIPGKHLYGNAARCQLQNILQLAMAGRSDYEFAFGMGRGTYRLRDMPEVGNCVSSEFVQARAEAAMDRYATIAASTDFFHKQYLNEDEQPVIIVQHVESGLRARFVQHGDGFGSVLAKSLEIDSIDPNQNENNDRWADYTGLGIGRGIYAEAHRLAPNVRWYSSAMNGYSPRLREKLHAADPYIWDGPCQWCNENLRKLGIYSWGDTDKDFFSEHIPNP